MEKLFFIEKFHHALKNILNDQDISLGLSDGKMGACIYFYHLAKSIDHAAYQQLAEELLDEVLSRINTVKTIDIENGLLGIALGVSYLIRNNHIQGDENEALKEIDDKVFNYVGFNHTGEEVANLIQILYYICIRKQAVSLKEANYLFNELSVQIINTLHIKMESIIKEDRIGFDIRTKLPLFLFVLSKVWQFHFYNHKIEKMMHEAIPFIVSKYAATNAQRLYLLWGIGKMNLCIGDERLTKHCNLLLSSIDTIDLLYEFRNKSVFIDDGITGVCLLIASLWKEEKSKLDLRSFYTEAKKRIDTSLIWEWCDNWEIVKDHLGLMGYSGVAMVRDLITRENDEA